jgi:hypothetical protein
LHASYKKSEVWTVPTLPWAQVLDPSEPYALFTFDPGKGMNPPEEAPTGR